MKATPKVFPRARCGGGGSAGELAGSDIVVQVERVVFSKEVTLNDSLQGRKHFRSEGSDD